MSCYYGVPSCAIPTCAIPTCTPPPSPVCYSVGALGSLCSNGGSGSSSGGSGGMVSSRSVSIISGATVGCVNQLPPSEIVVQPAPACLTIPGAILSASNEPIRIGGYSACGGGSSGGSSGSSGGNGGSYVVYSGSSGGGASSGRNRMLGSQQSSTPRVCYIPC